MATTTKEKEILLPLKKTRKRRKRKYTKKAVPTGAAAHGLKPGIYFAKVEGARDSFTLHFTKISL